MKSLDSCGEIYVGGWIIMMAIFEVIVIPCTFLKARFGMAVLLWGIIIFSIIISNLCRFIRPHDNSVLLFQHIRFEMSKEQIGIVLLVIAQCAAIMFFQHIDDDDAWYVGMANTSYVTDTINLYSPDTGDPMTFREAKDYVLSPLPIFWALLSKLCMIHPTIMIHTILPPILVAMAYISYCMLGKQLFNDDLKKRNNFIFFLCIFNIFGFTSRFTSATMLLTRVWQGKAMVAGVLLPILIYYIFEYRRKKPHYKKQFIKIMLILIAMDLASSSGLIFGLLTLGIFAVFPLWFQKRFKDCIIATLASIPNLIIGILYILVQGGEK